MTACRPILALCLAAPLAAQFAELAKAHLPLDHSGADAVACGDVDGDGDVDLIFAHRILGLRLYLNDGAGRFVEPSVGRFTGGVEAAISLALGDVDGDGDLDLAVGTVTRSAALFLNDGAGRYVDVTRTHLLVLAQRANALAFGDFDRDGDLDLFVACGEFSEEQRDRVLVNDGTGRLRDESLTRLPRLRGRTRAVAVGDVDGDGDLDVLAAGYPTRLYRNDGGGRFADAGDLTTSSEPWGVALGDVDGDGDLDALLGSQSPNQLFLNDGRGVFVEALGRLPSPPVVTSGVVLVDLDGDGDLDAALAAVDYTATAEHDNRVWLNDGRGSFTDTTALRMPPRRAVTAALCALDADHDGDADLVFANFQQQSRLYLNDGAATFADGTVGSLPTDRDFNRAAAVGDLDGDGDPDLVLGNYWDDSRVLLNDGAGHMLTRQGALPIGYQWAVALALADIDGDGDLDLFSSPDNHLLLNDGRGRFTDGGRQRLPLTSRQTKGFAVGDVDGDGDLDLVCANQAYLQGFSGNQDRLYLNDGRGFFVDVTAAQFPVDDTKSERVALVDLDGDGDLDLVFANLGASAVYRNDGHGRFADVSATHLPGVLPAHALAVGDLDGDGDADLLLANASLTYLLLNDGSGRFVDASTTHLPSRQGTATLVLGDLDGDGDLDVLLGDFRARKRLFVNDGRGHFVAASARLPDDAALTWSVLLADLDEDGDLDVFLGNQTQNQPTEVQSLLYQNLTRQLHSPFVPRAGGDLILELHSWPATPRASDLGAVMIAAGQLRCPLPPLGVFRLDPSSTFLACVPLPTPGGKAIARFGIPAHPSLVGGVVHAQGLVFEAATPRLTNLVSERISN